MHKDELKTEDLEGRVFPHVVLGVFQRPSKSYRSQLSRLGTLGF